MAAPDDKKPKRPWGPGDGTGGDPRDRRGSQDRDTDPAIPLPVERAAEPGRRPLAVGHTVVVGAAADKDDAIELDEEIGEDDVETDAHAGEAGESDEGEPDVVPVTLSEDTQPAAKVLPEPEPAPAPKPAEPPVRRTPTPAPKPAEPPVRRTPMPAPAAPGGGMGPGAFRGAPIPGVVIPVPPPFVPFPDGTIRASAPAAAQVARRPAVTPPPPPETAPPPLEPRPQLRPRATDPAMRVSATLEPPPVALPRRTSTPSPVPPRGEMSLPRVIISEEAYRPSQPPPPSPDVAWPQQAEAESPYEEKTQPRINAPAIDDARTQPHIKAVVDLFVPSSSAPQEPQVLDEAAVVPLDEEQTAALQEEETAALQEEETAALPEEEEMAAIPGGPREEEPAEVEVVPEEPQGEPEEEESAAVPMLEMPPPPSLEAWRSMASSLEMDSVPSVISIPEDEVPPSTAMPPPSSDSVEEIGADDLQALDADGVQARRAIETRPAAARVAMPGRRRRRRGRRAWYEQIFDEEYLYSLPRYSNEDTRREVDLIQRALGVKRGGSIIDVACGHGRHAVELAARGYEVVGLDLSLAMLTRAADAAQRRGVKINFIQGDMRELQFESAFDAAYCVGTSFGYFDDDTNAKVIRNICRALKASGLFLIETVNRDHVVREQPRSTWFQGEERQYLEETDFNYITSRLVVRRSWALPGGEQESIEYSIRLYSLHELGMMLHSNGFKVTEVTGHYATPGVFFGADSARLIILAQKR